MRRHFILIISPRQVPYISEHCRALHGSKQFAEEHYSLIIHICIACAKIGKILYTSHHFILTWYLITFISLHSLFHQLTVCLIKLSCLLIGITCHFNQNDLILCQLLGAV